MSLLRDLVRHSGPFGRVRAGRTCPSLCVFVPNSCQVPALYNIPIQFCIKAELHLSGFHNFCQVTSYTELLKPLSQASFKPYAGSCVSYCTNNLYIFKTVPFDCSK